MSEKSDVRIDLDAMMAAISRSTQFQKAVKLVADQVRDEAESIARVVAYDEGYYADLFASGTDQAQSIVSRNVNQRVRRNVAVLGKNRFIDTQFDGDGNPSKYTGLVGVVVNKDFKAFWVEYGSIAKGPRRVMLNAAEKIGKQYNIEVEPVYQADHQQNIAELRAKISEGRKRKAAKREKARNEAARKTIKDAGINWFGDSQ